MKNERSLVQRLDLEIESINKETRKAIGLTALGLISEIASIPLTLQTKPLYGISLALVGAIPGLSGLIKWIVQIERTDETIEFFEERALELETQRMTEENL